MDGTLINSTEAAERVWARWAERQGLDVKTFLPTMHGARAVDTVRRLGLPGVDPEEEAVKITEAEIVDVEGIVPLPGAAQFLAALPPAKWTIVTSSPLELAKRRLAAAGISMPANLVTAEDVKVGKPNPDCYLLAARKLGFDIKDCLVFEDAVPGILAGDAAGADVMVITATHKHPIETAHTTIRDYQDLQIGIVEHGLLSLARTVDA
ncbi:HAD-IA family hydrolase [Phyllobacterium endophyticum]|uniref:Glycerol-3-phosphatase n=2 Tax=Phyllobacterium endophyticum TaxID=1149773 RepID=A0A2P7AL39_9HYPH|nr:HAD-IA family hydrolase [Phyllobacterium endophyticum]PSH54942.1 glycerol-3-phosphatase [Phyllobacterium endophyticum]TYR43420.1 HAD-IA family hydrolase [Phyllobacterium endophyticum]